MAAELQEQKEAAREFKRQQEQTIQDVSNVMFSFLHNLGQGAESMQDIWRDTLDSIKALFLRTLTDMAAQALVKQILIPVGVTSGTGDLSGLRQLLGLGGGTGTTTVPGAAVTAVDEFGAVVPTTPTPATGLTAGTAVAGVGTGLTVGLVSNDLLQQAGVGSLTSQALAGAAGGAVAGAIIGAPTFIGAPVGAVIGAVVGAAVPLIMRLLGNVPDLPNFASAIQTGQARRPGPFLRGAALRGPFGFVGPTGAFQQGGALQVPAPEFARAFLALDEALATHLSARQEDIAAAALQAQGRGVTIKFEEFDNELADLTKDRMQTILGALAKEAGIAGHRGFRGRVFAGIGTEEEDLPRLEEAFRNASAFLETLSQLKDPEKPLSQAEQALKALTDQFADFADQARQYGVSLKVIDEAMRRQVHDFWKSVVDNLKMQQQNVLQAIGATRQTLEEALMTPATIFARRQEEFEMLQGEFAGAGAGKQVAMVPDLLRRVQELFQLGASTDVLGQDREALLRLQQGLLSFVDEIEQVAGKDAFNQQIAKAEEQVELLGDIKRVSETHLSEMNTTLHRIETFLQRGSTPFVGSFQQGGVVPQTGLALVHRGESITPRGSPTTVHLTQNVHLPTGTNRDQARQIGSMAWDYIEQEARLRKIPLRLYDK